MNPALDEFCIEAVEKVLKQIFWTRCRKNEFTEYATINDLVLGKGQVTPKTSFSFVKRTFPTGSLGRLKEEIWCS
jgi:hypothetical protein